MPNLAKYIIGLAVTAVALFLIWYFSNIVAYILISAVLAIIGKPLVDKLSTIKINGFKLPRWLCALATLITMWAVAVTFLWLFIPLVFNKINEFSSLDVSFVADAFQKPLESLQDFMQRFFAVENDNFSLVNEVTNRFTSFLNLDSINHALSSTVSIISGTVIALFSITFITFFFLKQDNLFQDMVVSLFPKKYEQNMKNALQAITKLLIRYFTGILAESTIIMLSLSLIFLLWGFSPETAFFMGLVMGILNVIPYIGPLIGATICLVVGIITPLPGFDIAGMVMVIAGSIAVIKGIDDFVLQPVLYSNRVHAHPLEIFIVILIAGSVAGVVGMLLAIPSYTVLRVFAKEFFYNFSFVQKLTENI